MKKVFSHVKKRVLAGFIFLIPLFAVLLLLQKLWTSLTGAGNYLVQMMGLKSLLGSNSVPVATACILVVLFYFFGWVVRFGRLNRMRDLIETSLLQYIPGYLSYKAQIQEKVDPKEDERTPVWVTTVAGKRPGLLIEENQAEAIVYCPNSPDSNNGQVLMVDKSKLKKMEINASAFFKSIQKFGKDMIVEAPVKQLYQ